jgi:hypothetical protein
MEGESQGFPDYPAQQNKKSIQKSPQITPLFQSFK